MRRFFSGIKRGIAKLMYGRYGFDRLGNLMIYLYLAVVLVLCILNVLLPSTLTRVLYFVVPIVMIGWIFFRIFSKNIAARRRENDRFFAFFRLRKSKFRDRKTHVYRKCPRCKAVLRLPKAKGKHYTVCPACKNRFEVRG